MSAMRRPVFGIATKPFSAAFALCLFCAGFLAHGGPSNSVAWKHPAGISDAEGLMELSSRTNGFEWAREAYASKKEAVRPWLEIDTDLLTRVFPKNRGNVYHNFSCPADRTRLTFDPLRASEFKCPACGKTYAPDTDAGIYGKGDRYHGTMYDGWVCLFHLAASEAAADLAVLGKTEADGERYSRRAAELLGLYADVLAKLPTLFAPGEPQMNVIFTYHREGDSMVLYNLARAYELARDRLTAPERNRIEELVLRRMLKDVMLEPIYTYKHNNLYFWHRTILQTALALERVDLVDWCFGYGDWSKAKQPGHSSITRLLEIHFKPDGAYWEMCSGYHLYPLQGLCEFAVLSHHLSLMDPARFPPEIYDLTDPANSGGAVIRNALHWFICVAPPDCVMPTVGDSMAPKAGMDDYYPVAEAAHRYFGLKEVGAYQRLATGKRTWAALFYGSPVIDKSEGRLTSSFLSSGWVSLRQRWADQVNWVGLNALIAGGGHQHADRLTLLSHAAGQLLALEKATPYNDSITRELGTLSPSHSTVTVDFQSQTQGESLSPKQTPEVVAFLADKDVQFAEVRADHLYAQTPVYRRSVLLLEDVSVDFFDVQGGTNHDWMLQHAGGPPTVSVPTREGVFEPAAWLQRGNPRARCASTEKTWEASWNTGGVTSRTTMIGAPGTEVFALETYPIDNAVITTSSPPCQTLCVRRTNDVPFLCVHEAWKHQRNVRAIIPADTARALTLSTRDNSYAVLFAGGKARFAGDISIETDASCALLRNADTIVFANGTRLDLKCKSGSVQVRLDQPANFAASWTGGDVRHEITPRIQHDTRGGVDHPRSTAAKLLKFEGALASR